VLTFINLFKYVDRWVVASILEPMKADLHLTDTQLGWLASGFIIVYSMTSPCWSCRGRSRWRG
jgi:predicted MFS family arabinose efflux permease